MIDRPVRLAFIVTHPVQYYVPVYRCLSRRAGCTVRVFYTAHGGGPAHDAGFGETFEWDVPLRDGYDAVVVPNTAARPGSDRFFGVRNPGLVAAVCDWKPDAAVVTGYAYASHLAAIARLPARGVPVVFRGDSHLLNRDRDRWWPVKRLLLRAVYRRCARVLYVGTHNRAYFEACGVPPGRLAFCPHSIDTARFLRPDTILEEAARRWRREYGIPADAVVLGFAGKFEPGKRPLELIDAVAAIDDPRIILVLAGAGPLHRAVEERIRRAPARFRLLPRQNQMHMPVLYRLFDLFVLPSVSETWGLAVNEALACGRPVLVSDRVGCAADLVRPGENGFVFPAADWARAREIIARFAADPRARARLRAAARDSAAAFDAAVTADAVVAAVTPLLRSSPP